MKNKKILFFGIFLLFSLTGILYYFNNFTAKNIKFDENSIRRNIEKRKYTEDIIKQNQFDHIGKISYISTDFEDFLTAVDTKNNRGFLFSPKGKILKEVGKTGEAPWENITLKYVNFAEKDGYYAFDYSKQTIKKYSSSDSLLYYYKFDGHSVSHISRLKNDIFIVSFGDANDFLFKIVDIKLKKIINTYSIKRLIEKEYGFFPKRDLDLVFEGYFAKNTLNNRVVYSCNKAGLFFVFDISGKMLYFHKTIDAVPVPKPISKDRGSGIVEYLVEPDIYVNYSRCLDNKYIYILSNIISNKDRNRVIDMYNLSNGEYVKSISAPPSSDSQKSVEISINDFGILTIVYENMTIINFKIEL